MARPRDPVDVMVAYLIAGASRNTRVERDAAIRLDRANGMTLREIALKYGISRTYARRITVRAD